MASRNTVERKADVRVADTATRNLHDNLIWTGVKGGEFARLYRRVCGRQVKPVASSHACHDGPQQLTSRKVNNLRNAAGGRGDERHNAS